MKSIIERYGEWINRGFMLCTLTAMLWIQVNYLSRAEFKEFMEIRTRDFDRLGSKLDALRETISSLHRDIAVISRQQNIDTSAIAEMRQLIAAVQTHLMDTPRKQP